MSRWGWLAFALTACATGAPQSDVTGTLTPVTPATQLVPPPPGAMVTGDPAQVVRGRYLVDLLGCGSCHTDGALIGVPRMDRLLAGSRIGIAYSNPLEDENPGVVYAANLTPDVDTGIGDWTAEELVRMVRAGLDRHGRQQLPVMPWPVYSRMSDDDAGAIAAYLQSLAPVVHDVPDRVEPGEPARAPYVHFGVYTYQPD
jgi:mono/diheme cytochrome c family protein